MDKPSLYFADSNTLKRLSEIIQNVSHTNIFPAVLTADNYEKIGDNTWVKGNDHIEVANIRGEWKYRNLNCKWDTGNVVQFIANRYDEVLRQCNSISVIHTSAFIAKQYYQGMKKQLRSEHKPARRLADNSNNQAKKKI